jgi:Type II secretory pathway, ATPase PulE/Tfp pilus assembly pathway, ATPase PilB
MELPVTTKARMQTMPTIGQTIYDLDSYQGRSMHPGAVDLAKSMFDSGTPFIFFDDGELMVAPDTLNSHPGLAAELRSRTSMKVTKLTSGDSSTIQTVFRETLQNSANSNMDQGDRSAAENDLVNVIIEALRLKASDIHIFLRDPLCEICYRVDGKLSAFNSHKPLAYERAKKMLAVAYNWTASNNNSSGEFDLRSIQPTSFDIELVDPNTNEKTRVTLRLEKAPEYRLGDVKCSIRVSVSTRIKDLEELGIDDHIVSVVKDHMIRPHGMILISGPTGSGKTTFIHGALHYVPKDKNVYTLEDPVELVASYNPRISQQNLIPGETYDSQLRSLLRQDPDVMMIGELRDAETVHVAHRAALTGHLILGTIHTSNSLGTIKRMKDFGMSYADLAHEGALMLLVACRLVPKLCQKCKIPITNSYVHAEVISKKLGTINGVFMLNQAGCPECRGGTNGRVSVIEYIVVTGALRQFIEQGDLSGARNYLESHGWQSLQDIGWELISKGEVDPIDAEKELTDIILDSSSHFSYKNHRIKAESNNTQSVLSSKLINIAADGF